MPFFFLAQLRTSVIPALRRWRREHLEFKVSVGNIVKINKKKIALVTLFYPLHPGVVTSLFYK